MLPGDLALRKAVQVAYQLARLPSQDEVRAIAERWRPYRSLATSYLFSATLKKFGPPSAVRPTAGPLTTGPLTTGPLTTGPLTTGPLTTGPLTTGPLTTGPLTTGPPEASDG